jgi:predicted metal-dependent enzyme (double-stranded beta helix superfamily)
MSAIRQKESVMAAETRTQNAMERFIAKTRDLFAEESDLDKRWELLRPVLAELLADPEVIEASQRWPETGAGPDGRATNLLFYEDPDYKFVINGLARSANRPVGARSRIHDHGHIYTLYGVLTGHERIERYERIDDRSRPDYAEIRRTVDVLVGSGDIDLVLPFEVHSEVATGEARTAIVVRSEDGGAFDHGRYDQDTFAYYESPGPLQVPAEMFPSK